MSTDNITATIELARGGDTGAFAQIVRQYQSLVSGVLFSATGDFHKSEDFTQETFLIAWQKLGELRETENLAAWLCTIARNLVHRSHRKPTLEAGGLMPAAHALNALESPEPSPDTEILRKEQSEFVWSAIGEIDEKYRETLVLYYRSGQSVREIASATASTEEAVRQRLVRARKSLKVKLEEMVGSILTDTIPGETFTMTVMTALGAAMLTGGMAQVAVAATTGAAAVTGAATTGKGALGTTTMWSVIAPVAFFGWLFAMFFAVFWAGVRNAPTLRARRFRVYSIFWSFQYFLLYGGSLLVIAGTTVYWARAPFGTGGALTIAFVIVCLISFLTGFLFPLAYQRKMRRIVEDDLGLSGEYVESYSYQQVEQRFFLSLITNMFLGITIIAFLVFPVVFESAVFFSPPLGYVAFFALIMPVLYYPPGRYFWKSAARSKIFLPLHRLSTIRLKSSSKKRASSLTP